jgi:hypothetical protein
MEIQPEEQFVEAVPKPHSALDEIAEFMSSTNFRGAHSFWL